VKTKKKKTRGKKRFFRDERFRISVGIFLILFGLYLLFALISYFFTWKADQSFEFGKLFSDASVQVQNWAGKTGARLSDLLIHRWFGVFSLTIPALLLYAGLRFFMIRPVPFRRVFWFLFFLTFLGSLTIAFLLGNSNGYLGSGFGGAFGYFTTEWLNSMLGRLGDAFLLIFLNIAFFLFFFHVPVFPFRKKTAAATSSGADESVPATATGPLHEEAEDQEEEEEDRTIVFEEDHYAGTAPVAPAAGEEAKSPEEEVTLEVSAKDTSDDQVAEEEIDDQPYDPTLDLSEYRFPPVDLLIDYESGNTPVTREELLTNKNKIVETLAHYKIKIDKIKATIGPTVTLYEIVPAPGIRISKIKNLEDDIALSLSALGIRIIAPIPGRGTIGIEVPNLNPETVSMRSMITSRAFQEAGYDLPVALGRTISGDPYIFDLARAPHLLVAGATGQGKSVGLNVIITSLLYRKHPAELKFVFVDPKKVELALYTKLEKHYMAMMPDAEETIITDTDKVVNTLNALTIEMDNRYDLLTLAHVRSVKEYNEKFKARRLNPEKGHRYMPYIVLVIDEFADLIMTAGKNIEFPLTRLAQMGRAVGLHLVIATQRPTTNIITGTIKGNFPTRIAFKVTAMIDSRTILDSPGANQLVGRGDLLIGSGSDLTRVQCAFIDTSEVEAITDHISQQQSYFSAYELPEYSGEESEGGADVDLQHRDPFFDEAARVVVQNQQGSTSLIQRKLSIGYNRAGRIIDQLEAAGIVGPFEGSKARQVLIPDEYTLEQLLRDLE
jgi:S-DNA-T family DNA segregation ATPase FtsK/SpoIIIE